MMRCSYSYFYSHCSSPNLTPTVAITRPGRMGTSLSVPMVEVSRVNRASRGTSRSIRVRSRIREYGGKSPSNQLVFRVDSNELYSGSISFGGR